ncbi:MAG: hypothetical protein WCQ00_01155 [bacterium]
MLHLLTEQQRDKVLKEYRMRLVTVICGAIVFLSFVGLSLLMPSYLSFRGRVHSVEAGNLAKESSIESIKSQNFQEKIKLVDSNLEALKISIKILSPRESYEKILNSLPSGIILSRYTYSLIDDASASLSVDGVAVDRESLVEFQNKLITNPEFKGIDIPVSNFAKKKDLLFSIKFNLVKPVNK